MPATEKGEPWWPACECEWLNEGRESCATPKFALDGNDVLEYI